MASNRLANNTKRGFLIVAVACLPFSGIASAQIVQPIPKALINSPSKNVEVFFTGLWSWRRQLHVLRITETKSQPISRESNSVQLQGVDHATEDRQDELLQTRLQSGSPPVQSGLPQQSLPVQALNETRFNPTD